MIKKSIYPKTKRVKCDGDIVQITEKIDGSNLCIFKKEDMLHIAQRNTIIRFDELEYYKKNLYNGLYDWIMDNRVALQTIRNDSVVCGEWVGMGNIKYPSNEFDKHFYMFAKARINDNYDLYNIQYTHDNFIYPFEDLVIPTCIGVVPVVKELNYVPTKEDLDVLYEIYCGNVGRCVEGFVVNYKDMVTKYVRMKNGKLTEHFDRGE